MQVDGGTVVAVAGVLLAGLTVLNRRIDRRFDAVDRKFESIDRRSSPVSASSAKKKPSAVPPKTRSPADDSNPDVLFTAEHRVGQDRNLRRVPVPQQMMIPSGNCYDTSPFAGAEPPFTDWSWRPRRPAVRLHVHGHSGRYGLKDNLAGNDNLDRLARLEAVTRQSTVAVLKDGTQPPVSRSGYARLNELLR